MKKITCIILICVLLLCGCGKSGDTQTASSSGAVITESTPEVISVDSLLVDDENTGDASLSTEDLINEIIDKYVDAPLSDFVAEYGEPVSREYASSCLGDGEDGVLKYDNFTVYTYKEGDQETILDVR